jgi:hypothetical protein
MRARLCWTEKPTSFRFKDKSAYHAGLYVIVLKEGLEDGQAKIIVKGRGDNLSMYAPARTQN